jgi:hypothetical protein
MAIDTSLEIGRPVDPKPSVERIDELAHRIISGDILLPKFQRDFVWERNQIIELLDSIVKNYPIGSVLLWLSKLRLQSERTIADLKIAERAIEYPINYLLDGQQRLSTICGALYWDGKDKTSPWNIVYDLRRQAFEHLTTADDPPLHQIRMNKLPDAARFFAHVAALANLDAGDRVELKARAEALFNRFKDYKLATVTLGDMPLNDVAPIFERINSTGTRLTVVDLMRAATWSEEFDLIETIDEQVLDTIAERGFGGIDRKVILRNISAAAGGGFSVESIDTLRNKKAPELKAAAQATIDSYRRTTDFLRDEIKAPNDDIIPYANQFVVLAELFRLLPKASAMQFEQIRKWFWSTTLTSYFSGWNTGQMSTDHEMVKEFADGKLSTMAFSASKPTSDIWLVRQFRSNNAHAKMLGLMLAQTSPMDLLTGQKLTLEDALAWSNNREYHHIFPAAFLRRQKIRTERINCIANFALLTSASNKIILDSSPSTYFSDMAEKHGSNLSTILRSNLISQSAFEAGLRDDFDTFLKERSATLQQHALLLCGWDKD